MRRSLLVVLACALVLNLTACKAKKMLDQASISADLKRTGTTDLLKEASTDEYEAPSDGRLSEKQIQMYLKVREHEKKIAQVAKAELKQHAKEAEKSGEKSLSGMVAGFKSLGSVADLFTADIRAAKDLGYNTAEYQWIKEKVLEASGSVMTDKIAQAGTAMFDQQYEQAKKQFDEAKDETTKKFAGEMLEAAKKAREEMSADKKDEDPAIAYNKQLLSKHENAPNALAFEFSKFEDKEGETEKGMKEFQQQLDKAAAAAQNGDAEPPAEPAPSQQ